MTSETGNNSPAKRDVGGPGRKPEWLKTRRPAGTVYFGLKRELRGKRLVTVCEEAHCPNIGECWNASTATLMILGDTCTRGCRFCNVKTGNPHGALDEGEPQAVAENVQAMGLDYVVLTMVDRDDLADGGAAHVASVMRAIRAVVPEVRIEVLTGDFRGNDDALRVILAERPVVFAHNVETVERLTPGVRDRRASYALSLDVLARVKQLGAPGLLTKSSVMLGMGETREDMRKTLADLRERGVDFLTLGQYLQPTPKHLAVDRYVPPQEFDELGEEAMVLGFKAVASGPLVRSSFRARELYESAARPAGQE